VRTVSDAFLAKITKPKFHAVEARVLTPSGSEPLEVLDGTVTLDAQADSRGRLDLTVPASYAPLVSSDPLAPYGNEVSVGRGVTFDDGTSELVPLGVYRIEAAENTDTGSEFAVSISGVDRSVRFTEYAFETTFNPPDTNIPDLIAFLARAIYPEVQLRFASKDVTVPSILVINEGDTAWEVMTTLALACQCALYFDNDGFLTLAPLPTGLTPPVATLAEGEALVSASKSWTVDDVINRVVVTSAFSGDDDNPFRGEAVDDNPLSPTCYGSPLRKTYYFEDTFGALKSDAACQDSAESILALHLGLTASVSFEALVNPAIEPLDVVQVRRAALGLDERHIIDSITYPLGLDGQMSATTRAAVQVPA
jgi:hypothetical protein